MTFGTIGALKVKTYICTDINSIYCQIFGYKSAVGFLFLRILFNFVSSRSFLCDCKDPIIVDLLLPIISLSIQKPKLSYPMTSYILLKFTAFV